MYLNEWKLQNRVPLGPPQIWPLLLRYLTSSHVHKVVVIRMRLAASQSFFSQVTPTFKQRWAKHKPLPLHYSFLSLLLAYGYLACLFPSCSLLRRAVSSCIPPHSSISPTHTGSKAAYSPFHFLLQHGTFKTFHWQFLQLCVHSAACPTPPPGVCTSILMYSKRALKQAKYLPPTPSSATPGR